MTYMSEVYEQLTHEPAPEGGVGHVECPLPGHVDDTPSFMLYPDNWYCYGCGQGGDAIAFVRALTGASYRQAVTLLAGVEPIEGDDEAVPVVERKNFYDDVYGEGRAGMASPVWEWFAKKWPHLNLRTLLTDDVVNVWDSHLLIPHWTPDAEIVGVKLRTPDGGRSSFKGSVFTDRLYRIEERRPEHTHAVVCEGESDAWTWHYRMAVSPQQHVLSLPSGASVVRQTFLDELATYDWVVIATDVDGPGERAAEKLADGLIGRTSTSRWRPHTDETDVTDDYLLRRYR